MKRRLSNYYKQQFENWITPDDARLILDVLDDAASNSDRVCRQEFVNTYEYSQWVKGSIRKQFIDDLLRGVRFNGDVYGQPRLYTGKILDERKVNNAFTLLKSLKRVALIWHARPMLPLPSGSGLMQYLAALPESREQPLFPSHLHEDHLPTELDAFFLIRYNLDRDDGSGSTIGEVDVVVPSDDCRNIYCTPCADLRMYATPVIREADVSDLGLRLQNEAILEDKLLSDPESPINKEPLDDGIDGGLDINFRPDVDEE